MAAGLAASRRLCLASDELVPRLNGGLLHVSAPGFRFLTGKPLERIQNGASLAFDFQLGIWVQSNTRMFQRTLERFLISYDLWEERYSVSPAGVARRGASHLKAQAAESWCLESLGVPVEGLAPDASFWLRLEGRVEDQRDTYVGSDEPGINLARLIELFSRPAREQQPRWSFTSGPLRLSDLKKPAARGGG